MAVPDDRLASLCAELPELRVLLRAIPARRALLEQAVQAARRGEPVGDYLRQLGIVRDDLGVDEFRGPGTSSMPWETDGGHSVDGVYVCPVDVCLRLHERRPGDDLPTCHLHDRPLRFEPDR
ncbi:MAG TPA: hypothetical protein VG317_17080 [Pseudonocardiaceae bacterium]|nr:hypothetical protein [Pseudonocardiaceae bacterium]